jgi:hypothetical protein
MSTIDTLQQALDTLRADAARVAKRGVGMPMAGMVFWLASAAFGVWFNPKQAAFLMFIATGMVFPLGLLFSKLIQSDIMAKSPLSGLGMVLNFVQLFYWPVIILVSWLDARYVPFVFAVLFGSHFLPYGWFYRSRGYYTLGIFGPLASLIVQIAKPELGRISVPLTMFAVSAVAVAMVWRENAAQTSVEAARAA